ncbi:hypothetical protein EAI_15466 [Harpegnathos saltator]|uniref:Uncharacterized protein n=1 Tax=Harpegnathos saltator TaxID=610380 RepID=E2BC44_HARSA|nr:hypothetical protein EAI_15466 [Harpegnathos saltator]
MPTEQQNGVSSDDVLDSIDSKSAACSNDILTDNISILLKRDAHGFRIASQNKEAEIPLASFSLLAEASLSIEQFASPNFTYGSPPPQERPEQALQ